MAQRQSLVWTELRVGLLVIASFVLLVLAIFYIGGQSGIFTPKYSVTIFFPAANGLRTGAEVWLEGVTIGNVTSVRISQRPEPSRRVEAVVKLDASFQQNIRTDSKITIETTGLLGDNHVDISRGTEAGQTVTNGGTLQGTGADDIRKIITGTNDILANLDVMTDKVVELTGHVTRGEGTLGKLLVDESIYDNLNKTTLEANALVRDARTGQGTVGRLISDDEMYKRVNKTLERVDNMVSKVERGEGTIGKFMNDPSLYNKADQLVSKFDSIADNINRGQGTMGKLINDDAFYNDARTTLTRVNTLVDAAQNGDGTVGKLIKDPTLFNTLNQTSSEVLKLLYDFRQDPKKFLTINFRLF